MINDVFCSSNRNLSRSAYGPRRYPKGKTYHLIPRKQIHLPKKKWPLRPAYPKHLFTMRTRIILTVWSLAATWLAAEPAIQVLKKEDSCLDFVRGTESPALARFLSTESHGRPYLHPLRSPDGKALLTQFSPGHHRHQTGLYWGPTRINGRDYFHNYNKKFWSGTKLFHHVVAGEDHPPTVGSTSDLLNAKGEVILRDEQRWSLMDHGAYYTLDLEWKGTARADVTIGKYAYGGLFLRMPWKRGIPAGCINSEGLKNQAGEGKPAKWVDLGMQVAGLENMGRIAIIDHPGNENYPTLWRIDGQFGIGPALSRKGDIRIPMGTSKVYRYRLVVYEGDHDPALLDKETKAFGEK